MQFNEYGKGCLVDPFQILENQVEDKRKFDIEKPRLIELEVLF